MPIPDYHYYEGAALSLITSEGSFNGLRRIGRANNHDVAGHAWALNDDKGIYVKHSTSAGNFWVFNFIAEHQDSIRDMVTQKGPENVFVVLVCRDAGMCVLTYGEYESVLAADHRNQRAIGVRKPARGGFRVTGPGGRRLDGVIPLNRFPGLLFGTRG